MTTSSMAAVLQRLSDREMLINTETAGQFIQNLDRMSSVTQAEIAGLENDVRHSLCLAYGWEDREPEDRKPFVYSDGVAVIPIHGSLINRCSWSWGFVTGYNAIRRQMNAALDDDDVEYLVFDVNTPGGEAAGCFELAREIIASRRVKPSLAFVDAMAASGGMALAGAATTMWGIPSARIGSIGVYRQHVSLEGSLAKDGVKITFATAGAHKVDGHPYADIPDSVLKDWTKDAQRTWDDFIALVADARGMEPDAVRSTEARVYRADEALDLGLIDAVKTAAEAIPAFIAEMGDNGPSDDEEDDEMTTETSKNKNTEVASVDYDKIGAMIATNVAAAMSTMTRATAIKDHGKAKGQVALAARLAANDKISEADAIAMIDDAASAAAPSKSTRGKGSKGGNKASRVEDNDGDEDEDDLEGDDDADDVEGDDDEDGEQEARDRRRGQSVKTRGNRDKVNHFDNAMRSSRQPNVGGGSANDDHGGDGKPKGGNALLADYAAHTGLDLRKKA